MREDGRRYDELRPVRIQTGFTDYAPGSVLVEFGKTRVLCTAMMGRAVPAFLEGRGTGFVTAEYNMLPSSTPDRKRRENARNGPDGRSTEISRLIGRALRCAVDLQALGERMVHVDCDVLQADGGTRTAAITGGYVALALAMDALSLSGEVTHSPILAPVAAVSAGIVKDQPLLDLCYAEDSCAQVDCNFVMTGDSFIEVQGTGEKRPVTKKELEVLMALGENGIKELYALQLAAMKSAK